MYLNSIIGTTLLMSLLVTGCGSSSSVLGARNQNDKVTVAYDGYSFSASPNNEVLAKKYSYYIEDYTESSGYFERKQYNLNTDGTVASLITACGNMYHPDDAYICDLDDLSCLYENEDFENIYYYTYDDQGRVIEKLIYDRFASHINPSHTLYYTYNDDYSVSRKGIEYGENDYDEFYTKTEYYDEHGNLLASPYGTEYSYTYDSDGNLTSRTSSGDYGSSTVVYTYEHGRMVKETYSYIEIDGSDATHDILYKYDKGNLISIVDLGEDNREFARTEYSYSDDGLLLEINDLVNKKIYTYEYF